MLISSWLIACEQPADVVLTTEALDSGSLVVDGPPLIDEPIDEPIDSGIACDPSIAAVYAAFSRVALADCTFAYNDRTVIELLAQHIFSLPSPMPVPEGNTVSVCDIVGIDFAFPRPDGTVVLCPGYCTVLETWLMEHELQSRACLPGSGS